MARITLSQIMDSEAVDRHLGELKAAFASTSKVVIDCESVVQIGTIGLQLIASGVRSARERGIELVLDCSALVETTVKLAGLSDLLLGSPQKTGDAT